MRVITGKARGIQLKTPQGMLTRPTADRVKEALFSIIRFDVANARVLDLFGGTGQLGIEALSQGAKSAVFVDAREEACALIRENLKRTRLSEQGSVVRCDYLDYLNRCREKFDIIFLDPPYASELLNESIFLIPKTMSKNGIIICEHPVESFLPDKFVDFYLSKVYKYGKIAISVYRRKGLN